METKQEATELSQASATGAPLQVLWFFVHLAMIYLIVHFCTPWLAGWVRGNLLPFLQQPTSSAPLEFLFSHLFAFSFFPALLAGAANAKFRHGSAEWVWLIPAVILIYKLVTFSSATSVLAHNASWPAFHHYFSGNFSIPRPRATDWKDFWILMARNNDATRGVDQLNFTAPFYAAVAYSAATWIAVRTNVTRKAQDALKDWEERRFGSRRQPHH